MADYDTPINTEEPQVLVVGAFCEECGELPLISPDHELVPFSVEEIRSKADLYRHAPPGGCGGRILLATEPYIPPN